MRWTIANILTVSRLILAPVIAIIFLIVARPLADWLVVMVYIVTCITDYLDGHLARSRGQKTKVGQVLDPIADKAVVMIALMVIVAINGFDALIILPATVIILRELFISGVREFMANQSVSLAVTVLAKWKTASQMVAIGLLLTVGVFTHDATGTGWLVWVLGTSQWLIEMAGIALLWVASVLSVVTGAGYVIKTWPLIKEDA